VNFSNEGFHPCFLTIVGYQFAGPDILKGKNNEFSEETHEEADCERLERRADRRKVNVGTFQTFRFDLFAFIIRLGSSKFAFVPSSHRACSWAAA
jgi:hypothetical protein